MMSRTKKSPNAFRTISEVADIMGVPQHVLRFWESKFSQICPMKRGGGRRYYRPEDVDIIEVIRKLLHEDGFTIKGAQKYLKEHGVKNVIENFNATAENENIQEPSGIENDYESQILTITRKSTQLLNEEADTVASLKDLRSRLQKIRQHLKVDV